MQKNDFYYPSFRFTGEIPTGKFEFNCVCGKYSGPSIKLIKGSQSITCESCGTRFDFVQQRNHFHLNVCISEDEQFQQECKEGLHK